jgi:hypothetical protein
MREFFFLDTGPIQYSFSTHLRCQPFNKDFPRLLQVLQRNDMKSSFKYASSDSYHSSTLSVADVSFYTTISTECNTCVKEVFSRHNEWKLYLVFWVSLRHNCENYIRLQAVP